MLCVGLPVNCGFSFTPAKILLRRRADRNGDVILTCTTMYRSRGGHTQGMLNATPNFIVNSDTQKATEPTTRANN